MSEKDEEIELAEKEHEHVHEHVEHEEHEHHHHHHHHDEDDDDDDCGCHHHYDDDDDDEDGCECCHHHEHEHSSKLSALSKILISAVLFALALFVSKFTPLSTWCTSVFGNDNGLLYIKAVSLVLYFAAYLLVGLSVLREAVENLLHGEFFGEEFLMSVATVGAVCMGEYPEAVAVMILFQLGEYLEGKAVGRSKRSIRKLMDVRPDTANVKRNDTFVSVDPQSVNVGEIICVAPGERVALDGVVVTGSSFVDTSALTGESVPREVLVGSEIFAGSVNKSGVLEIKVTKPFAQSTVSRVLDLVEHAQEKKAKAQKFISRFSKIYTPVVCLLALLVALVPPLFFKAEWNTWIYRALMFLVVSCPCALVISVPLTFFAGIGLASRNGVLVKGSTYLELLSKMSVAVFDKTGTLTKGVFEVTAVHPVNPEKVSADELLAYATHAEYYSKHPISRSLKVVHHCAFCENLRLENAEEISGHGVRAVVEGKTVIAGSLRFMEDSGVSGIKACPEDDRGTIVHVAVNGEYAGHIIISDVAKEDAVQAVALLKKQGVKKTVLLTGDTESAASLVAERIGLDEVHAQLLPQDKVTCIETLLSQKTTNSSVAFVGDGINDAPVLTRADIGIAMGGIGSDAAIEAADVVIMDDKPSKVALAVKLSKKTMRIVWQNIVLALGVKVAIMVLSMLGITNMMLAIFGDVGVMMLCVANSLRLNRKK
ncbi:MAG TPA: cadmium-translocating P-type ATPase [Treponema sp.]|nr:cadmium-translocating P-type ATPase [Treponema sp.]